MFTNRGTSLVHSGDTWELNYGGNVQGQKSCISSFMPNIRHFYIKIDKFRFPCTAGLDMPTSSEIKGIEEQLNELHTDKVSLR